MPRQRLIQILLTTLVAGVSTASTLDPGHPVWQRSDIDRASLLGFQETIRREAPRAGRIAAAQAAKGLGAHGVRVLVIPVYYEGDSPPSQPTRAELEHRIFGAGESTVRGYWQLVSAGGFVIEGEVLPWQRMPSPLGRYRNVLDGRLVGNGLAGPRELVRDALRAASERWDLHRYDGDGADGVPGSGDDDGFVDLLLVLHPDVGFEVDPVAIGPAMLAHSSFLEVADPQLAPLGVQGGNYALASAVGPLGVWVHEFGHLLGLDDLYDLRVSGTLQTQPERGGLGLWSLMAHGTWGGAGSQPSSLDPYSRRRLGWEQAQDWDSNAQGTLARSGVGANSSVALLPFGEWEREYFLLELRARNAQGIVDAALPGSGALLYHVDAARGLLDDHDPPRVTLIQADGRDDLGDLANNGDAGDAFVAPTLLDATTTPSLQSVRPDPSRPAPALQLGAFASGSQSVDYFPSSIAQLRLANSQFDATPQARTHLLPGESAVWDLRFSVVGPAPAGAELDSVWVDPRLELSGVLPQNLSSSGGSWLPSAPLQLRARQPMALVDAPRLRLRLRVDGVPREFEFGVPVGNFDGLSGDEFYRWQPEVLAALGDTTRFELLGLSDLPANTTSGWQLVTEGTAGYANQVESTLTSPWFAVPALGSLHLWSDAATEAAGPGECFDGGVLEIQRVDRPWEALTPLGLGSSFVRASSSAPTADALGFGGEDPGWRSYEAELPAAAHPVRVRLRFGSNSLWHDGHWSIAGLGTRPEPLHATLSAERDPLGQWVADIELLGDAVGLSNHELRLYGRRPADPDWVDLDAAARLALGNRRLRIAFSPPAEIDVLQLGLFVQSLSDPTEPRLLLAMHGLRAGGVAVDTVQLLQNPARGLVSFSYSSSSSERRLEIFDLRGRRVRLLRLPAGSQFAEWDGSDDSGTVVAAGRYFVMLQPSASPAVALTWIK